jgi:hypothetical protein
MAQRQLGSACASVTPSRVASCRRVVMRLASQGPLQRGSPAAHKAAAGRRSRHGRLLCQAAETSANSKVDRITTILSTLAAAPLTAHHRRTTLHHTAPRSLHLCHLCAHTQQHQTIPRLQQRTQRSTLAPASATPHPTPPLTTTQSSHHPPPNLTPPGRSWSPRQMPRQARPRLPPAPRPPRAAPAAQRWTSPA